MNDPARFKPLLAPAVAPRPIPVYLVEFEKKAGRRYKLKALLILFAIFVLWIAGAVQ